MKSLLITVLFLLPLVESQGSFSEVSRAIGQKNARNCAEAVVARKKKTRVIVGIGEKGPDDSSRRGISYRTLRKAVEDMFSFYPNNDEVVSPTWFNLADNTAVALVPEEVEAGDTANVLLVFIPNFNENSPEFLRALMSEVGTSSEDLLVLQSEIDLKEGAVDLRKIDPQRTPRGNLQIIALHKAFPSFYRLRLGVGRPPAGESIPNYLDGSEAEAKTPWSLIRYWLHDREGAEYQEASETFRSLYARGFSEEQLKEIGRQPALRLMRSRFGPLLLALIDLEKLSITTFDQLLDYPIVQLKRKLEGVSPLAFDSLARAIILDRNYVQYSLKKGQEQLAQILARTADFPQSPPGYKARN